MAVFLMSAFKRSLRSVQFGQNLSFALERIVVVYGAYVYVIWYNVCKARW